MAYDAECGILNRFRPCQPCRQVRAEDDVRDYHAGDGFFLVVVDRDGVSAIRGQRGGCLQHPGSAHPGEALFQVPRAGRQRTQGPLAARSREAALRGGRSKKLAIVPGTPRTERIDPAHLRGGRRRGHAAAARRRTRSAAEEKQILKRWIAGGAEYSPHWAFVPPRQRPLPKVKQTSWPRNPIDRFVLARLEARD